MKSVVDALKAIGKALVSALLTEAFIKRIIVFLIEMVAKKTDNKIDDEVVKMIKEALYGKQEEKEEE